VLRRHLLGDQSKKLAMGQLKPIVAIQGFAAGPCSKLSIVHCNEFDKSAVSPSRLRGVADFTCALVREMLCLTLDVRLFVLWRIM